MKHYILAVAVAATAFTVGLCFERYVVDHPSPFVSFAKEELSDAVREFGAAFQGNDVDADPAPSEAAPEDRSYEACILRGGTAAVFTVHPSITTCFEPSPEGFVLKHMRTAP